MKRLTEAILATLVIIVVLVVTVVPVVPFSLTIDNPGFPYTLQGYRACQSQYIQGNIVNGNDPAFQHCIAQYLIPPFNLTGYSSISFRLLGIGLPPFPQTLSTGEQGFYSVLHFSGAKIIGAELVPQKNVVYDPSGITITNSTVSPGFTGTDKITVTVANRSGQTLGNPVVFVSVPGSSGNYTDADGVTWMFSIGTPSVQDFAPCISDGGSRNLTSGGSCKAVLSPFTTLHPGAGFRYSVGVQGYLGNSYAITRQTYTYSPSVQAVDELWVNAFVKLVNSARSNSSLTESQTLDQFAKLRFDTAVTQPDISDYGFSADVSTFFGANATKPTLAELLFYPDIPTETPYSYLSTIQESAPTHWAGLMDQDYTHFGFYVGTGPYEVVQQPCSAVEVPGAGVNITQYFESHGCKVSVQQSTWLALILSS